MDYAVGYTQYGWSALRRRTRRSVLNSMMFSCDVVVRRARSRAAAGVPPRAATAASAIRAIGKRRTGARTCAGISSKRARAPAARPPSPPFLLPVPDETQRPRPDCNRVYIAAGPPQSTVLSPRQARVDRAPDSRVLRPSESLKVDSRRARSHSHTHTQTHRSPAHRTGSGRRDSQGRASGRPCSLTSHDTPRPFTKTKARTARWTAA